MFRIYENGCDIDLSKLYPPVKFPVSRGTPTISSLIKWDHSYKFHVMDYEVTATKAERSYLVNLSDPDYEFIQGHSIDGESMNNDNYSINNNPVTFSKDEFSSQLLDICI